MVAMKKICKFSAKRIALLAALTGLGLVAFLLEGLLVPSVLPGMKLGFANFFTLLALLIFGLPSALAVVAVRTALAALLMGNPSAILYSLTAGMVAAFSARAMLALLPRVSVVCVSVVSAVVHNMVQLCVYMLLTKSLLLLSYAPWLCLAGCLAGAVVGLTLHFTVKAAPRALLSPVREGGLA